MMNSVEPPADVDDQTLVGRHRQRMRGADVDQASLFAAGDDLDRKAKRFFSQRQKFRCILGHAQRVGCNHAHSPAVEPAKAFAKTPQGVQRPRLRRIIQTLVRSQARSKADRLLHRIQRIDLVIDHAPYLQAETVGTQIDSGDGFVNHQLEATVKVEPACILPSTPACQPGHVNVKNPPADTDGFLSKGLESLAGQRVLDLFQRRRIVDRRQIARITTFSQRLQRTAQHLAGTGLSADRSRSARGPDGQWRRECRRPWQRLPSPAP